MVARIGGDEFAIIVVEPFTFENAAWFAELLVKELRAPFLSFGFAGAPPTVPKLL